MQGQTIWAAIATLTISRLRPNLPSIRAQAALPFSTLITTTETRGDVLTVSLHADPKTDYPFYWGHADETGAGKGAGANLNLPMPRGTAWPSYRAHLAKGIEKVAAFKPDILLVPYGADTFIGDPISFFDIKTEDYKEMGEDIAALGLPTLISMEGGYAIDALGANTASFLAGFA